MSRPIIIPIQTLLRVKLLAVILVRLMVAGGIAFAATKAMTSNKTQNVKKATGKAIKAVGAVIESLQM